MAIKKLKKSSVGIRFEIDAKAAFFEAARNCKNVNYEDVNDEEDAYEGTDFMFMGYRVDVTYFFSGKDNTTTLVAKPSFIGSDLKIGLRTGNSHRVFDEPVIVIGFDLPDNKDVRHLLNVDAITTAYKEKMNFIVDYLSSDDFFDEFDRLYA